mmetsp:Transcript_56997/g.152236  ORF Transcript_56997/g.152236 Transcript_56997/m.152236 type:complete len:238 (-) Transcript_56997:1354-2067(-)
MLTLRPHELPGDSTPHKPLHGAHTLVQAHELLAAKHAAHVALNRHGCVVAEEPQPDPPPTHERLDGCCSSIQLLAADMVAPPPGLDLHGADAGGLDPVFVLGAIRVPGAPGTLDALSCDVLDQARRMLPGTLSDQRSLLNYSVTMGGLAEHAGLSQDQGRSGGTHDRSIWTVIIRRTPDRVPLPAGFPAEVQDVVGNAGRLMVGLSVISARHYRLMLLIGMLLDHIEMGLWGLETVQ